MFIQSVYTHQEKTEQAGLGEHTRFSLLTFSKSSNITGKLTFIDSSASRVSGVPLSQLAS